MLLLKDTEVKVISEATAYEGILEGRRGVRALQAPNDRRRENTRLPAVERMNLTKQEPDRTMDPCLGHPEGEPSK